MSQPEAGGIFGMLPAISGPAADMLDRFHLTVSVASDASRVLGKGELAEHLERLERR